MLTNFKIDVECSHSDGSISMEISDRNTVLASASNNNTQIEIPFQIKFPNRLTIKINTNGQPDRWVKVCRVKVGTLEFPESIFTQIFNFSSADTPSIVTPFWNNSGTVTVDLFAEDWIQYHLLYGNKISI